MDILSIIRAKKAEKKAQAVQTQLDNIVVEGDSSVEAAQARVNADGQNFTNLKQRLDTENTEIKQNLQETTVQLAEKASKEEVDEKVSQVVSGSPKGTFSTLSALQAAKPSGDTGVYVVTADGNWYYWNGTTWVSGGVYQSTSSDQFPATNRVSNGDFSNGVTGWTPNFASASASNNVVTLTGLGTSATPHLIQNVGNRTVGDKYYSKVLVRALTANIQRIQLFNGVGHNVYSPVLNEWYEIDIITESPTNNQYFSIYFFGADAASTNGEQIEIKFAMELNLTKTYGSGKEPTISEIRESLSRFTNNWFNATKSLYDARKAYFDIKTLQSKKVTETDLQNNAVSKDKIEDGAVSINKTAFSKNTKNLFSGVYEKLSLYGALDNPVMVQDDLRRTAVIPIEAGDTYTISVYGEKNAFRIATADSLPTFNVDGQFFPDNFLLYNDVGRQFSFENSLTDRYLYVMVSSSGQEPLMQVEKGGFSTSYKPYKIVDEKFLPDKKENENLLPVFRNTELVSNSSGPRFIDYFEGKMWGYRFDGGFYHSVDEGRNWVAHSISWDHTNWGWVQRLVPTSDGEVIAVSEKHIRKSIGWNTGTITWSTNKIIPNTNCVFPIFGFDGDGEKFIIVEYANGTANWQHSRFVHVSLDSGNTFAQVYDSLAEYGAEINNLTHLHAACYDRWADRFYFSEGHSPAGGLYYSEDDGATWHQSPGHRDGVLYSQGIQDRVGDTNGPTVIIATDEGLVMGSDNQNNGVFGMVRKDNPQDEVVEWIYQTNYTRKGVQMFAQRGFRDPESGTVYIAFRSEWEDVPPIIVSATPRYAKLAYEYPTLPVVGGADRFMAIAKTSESRIVSNCEFSGVPHVFRSDLEYPNTEIINILRIELKRLGLM